MLTLRPTIGVLVSLALLLGGCGASLENGNGEQSSAVSGERGVDYAFSRPFSPQALHNAGYTFAARYLSYDSPSSHAKILFRSEADALIAAGVDIVANWEWAADDALNGFAAGVDDANAAQAQAAAAGIPDGRPIYFSVDFDASPGQEPAIDDYMDGVASVIGRNRTGAYGGYWVIKRLFDGGKIQWGWQTYAWSGGQWDPRAQLRQVQNDVSVAGADADVDVAAADDFGQWGHSAQTSCNGHTTGGAIAAEYAALGGCSSFLGGPTTDETATPDGVGRFNHFQNGGSIYWTPNTGAHEAHGDIHIKWAALGYETSALGYPLNDESPCADGVGRYNHFQNGSIYWTPSIGAHEVQGDIFADWAALGWETGALGYPISDEYDVPGGRRSDFQHGSLIWNAQTRVVTQTP